MDTLQEGADISKPKLQTSQPEPTQTDDSLDVEPSSQESSAENDCTVAVKEYSGANYELHQEGIHLERGN
jgi:hypothetical protein